MLIQQALPDIHSFWERWDDPKLKSPKDREEESDTITNKLVDFEDEPLRYIVGQSASTIDLRKIMDEGKILLVKLDRRLEQATKLVGSIIVALILSASASGPTKRQFHLYADEFQNFATEDFAVLLEEARKSAIGITMAHQNRAQLELSDRQADKNLKARTLNVGNLVVFRVPTDAESLAGQFQAVPKPPEIIDEPIREPMQDVGAFLLTHKHPNKAVNDFVEMYLRPNSENAKMPTYINPGRQFAYGKSGLFKQLCEFIRQVIATSNAAFPFPVDTQIVQIAGGWWFYDEKFPAHSWLDNFFHDLRRERINNPILASYIDTLSTSSDGRAEKILKAHNISKYEMCYAGAAQRVALVHITVGFNSNDREIEASRATIAKEMVEGLEIVETFFVSLRQALKALLAEPVMVDSGRFRQRQLSEETIANAQARVASELVRLPKFTAMVKLSDGNGNPVEHTVQTYPPGKGLHGQALRERQERIRQRNIRDGYLRDRAKVDAEIFQRQQLAAQPIPAGGNKPASFPSAQRKVLLCSSCGVANQQGAKFCNQCGARL